MTYPTMPRPEPVGHHSTAVPVNAETAHALTTLEEAEKRTLARLAELLGDITTQERHLANAKTTAVELEGQAASLAAGIAALKAGPRE